MKRFAALLLASMAMTCGNTETKTADTGAPVTIALVVYSGRENPPPETTSVRAGTEVTLRVKGLGPAKARVLAPDGTTTTTRDAPLQEDGSVVGTEQRFIAGAAGKWTVEVDGAPGAVLAYVNAS